MYRKCSASRFMGGVMKMYYILVNDMHWLFFKKTSKLWWMLSVSIFVLLHNNFSENILLYVMLTKFCSDIYVIVNETYDILNIKMSWSFALAMVSLNYIIVDQFEDYFYWCSVPKFREQYIILSIGISSNSLAY